MGKIDPKMAQIEVFVISREPLVVNRRSEVARDILVLLQRSPQSNRTRFLVWNGLSEQGFKLFFQFLLGLEQYGVFLQIIPLQSLKLAYGYEECILTIFPQKMTSDLSSLSKTRFFYRNKLTFWWRHITSHLWNQRITQHNIHSYDSDNMCSFLYFCLHNPLTTPFFHLFFQFFRNMNKKVSVQPNILFL